MVSFAAVHYRDGHAEFKSGRQLAAVEHVVEQVTKLTP